MNRVKVIVQIEEEDGTVLAEVTVKTSSDKIMNLLASEAFLKAFQDGLNQVSLKARYAKREP